MGETESISFMKLEKKQHRLVAAANDLFESNLKKPLKWGEGQEIYVAIGAGLLGVARVSRAEEGAWANINNIVVDAERRSEGIGTLLLAETLIALEMSGCKEVHFVPCDGSEVLAQKCGFNFPNEDSVSMEMRF